MHMHINTMYMHINTMYMHRNTRDNDTRIHSRDNDTQDTMTQKRQ